MPEKFDPTSFESHSYQWETTGGNRLRPDIFRRRIESMIGLERIYNKGDVIVACIDEGMPPGVDAAYTAGSGILTNGTIADILRDKNIAGITSHKRCGAAALYAKWTELQDDPDEVGESFSRSLAEQLGVEYIGRIGQRSLRRPATFHNARALYYDGTSRGINANLIPGMPPGFMHSRGFIGNPVIGKFDAELAVQIAMGNSGFGERFTADAPFHLVGITDRRQGSISPDQLKAELAEITYKNDRLSHQVIMLPR